MFISFKFGVKHSQFTQRDIIITLSEIGGLDI